MRLPAPFAPWSQLGVLVVVLLCGCTPAARLRYESKPFASIMPTTSCGRTADAGVNVYAEAPAACPDLADVDAAAKYALRAGRIYDALGDSLAGASVVYVVPAIDCSDKGAIARAHYVRGCTARDISAVQVGGPLAIGFDPTVTRHELGHALLWRLGVEDTEAVDGTHFPMLFWSRIDGPSPFSETDLTTWSFAGDRP